MAVPEGLVTSTREVPKPVKEGEDSEAKVVTADQADLPIEPTHVKALRKQIEKLQETVEVLIKRVEEKDYL